MAAATLVNTYQQPGYQSSYNRLHSRKSSRPDAFDPYLPPIQSARWFSHDELSPKATTTQPQTYSSLGATSHDIFDLSPPTANTSPGKLKKKQIAKQFVQRRSLDRSNVDGTPCESITPMDSTDSEAHPVRARHSRSLSKDKYLKTLQKRFRDRNGSDAGTVDLSLTMEENEKRSGLAISSQTQSPDTTKDVDSQFARAHGHARSTSNASISPSDINLGGPRAGFMQPMKIESRPHTPLTNRHSFTEMEWKMCPDAVDSRTAALGLGIDPGAEPRQRAATFDATGLPGASKSHVATPSTGSATWDAAASAPVTQHRPRMRVRLSNGSSTKITGNTSQSTLSSAKQGRTRRNTSQSYDSNGAMSPLSRTSTDRTMSFKRGFSFGSRNNSMLSEVDRQSALDNAREQFKQKQEAKARKYDEQDRRTKEKRERKVSLQEDKRDRKSSASSRLQSKSTSENVGSPSVKKRSVTMPAPAEAAPSASPPRRRESSVDGVRFERTLRPAKAKTPQKSSKGSGNLLTWCKTRILHLR